MNRIVAYFSALAAAAGLMSGCAKEEPPFRQEDNQLPGITLLSDRLPAVQNITATTFYPVADALVMEEVNVAGHDFTAPVTGVCYHRLH